MDHGLSVTILPYPSLVPRSLFFFDGRTGKKRTKVFDYFYLVHHQAIARAIDGGISAVLAVHTRVWRTLVEARFLPWLARAVLFVLLIVRRLLT